jgi:ABC-type branched-subunit amino acid transport system permease subunit
VAVHGVNPFAAIVLAALIAAVISLPVSVLVLRLSGGYFAVATLVIAAVFQIAATLSPSVGGTTGVTVPGLAGYDPVLREALIALQTLYVEPTTVFSIQYSVDMLFMVLIGGMGTIEGPVLGALVLFGLQEALSSYGAWYLVIVGGLAVAATLISSRGLWGFAAGRFGWSLLPVGYRVRPPRG